MQKKVIILLSICFVMSASCSNDKKVKNQKNQTETNNKISTNTLNPTNQSLNNQTNQQNSHPQSHSTQVITKTTIPLNANEWHSLQYRSIPSNKIQFNNNTLTIRVHHSASPLIYPMTSQPILIKNLSIKGSIDQLIPFSNPQKQGEKGFDDFTLRLGLVLLGNKTLNWLEKKLAPSWIKTMHSLAPSNQGISYIHFLNAVNSSTLLNKKRTHPLSQYIKEHYVWLIKKPGNFSYSYQFQKPKPTTGLWISTDGDDTKSQFTLTIYNITINSQGVK